MSVTPVVADDDVVIPEGQDGGHGGLLPGGENLYPGWRVLLPDHPGELILEDPNQNHGSENLPSKVAGRGGHAASWFSRNAEGEDLRPLRVNKLHHEGQGDGTGETRRGASCLRGSKEDL
jgi:hypothetical protein